MEIRSFSNMYNKSDMSDMLGIGHIALLVPEVGTYVDFRGTSYVILNVQINADLVGKVVYSGYVTLSEVNPETAQDVGNEAIKVHSSDWSDISEI